MLEISSNSMSIARSCWKKYYWQYIRRIVPIQRPVVYILGSVMHSAFEMFYNGFDDAEIINYIATRMDEEAQLVEETDKESMVIAKYTALAMWCNYPTKDLTNFEEVKSEIEFKVPLGVSCRGVRLVGRMDGLVKKDGRWWVREFKTTSQSMRQFEARIDVSAQASCYVWAAKKIGIDVAGVIYDIIKKPLLRKSVNEDMHTYGSRIANDYQTRQDFYYSRHYLYRSPVDMKLFENDMITLTKDIKRARRTETFYRNPDSCWNWNSECPYKKICYQEIPDQTTIDLFFVEKDKETQEKK